MRQVGLMLFDFLFLRIAFLVAGCAAAAYTDAKSGLILDKITYPMIVAGIVLNLVWQQWLWLGLGMAVFGLGYIVYYAGKFGGGDVKLFTGVALLLPFYQGSFFLLNALFAACLTGVTFYSVFFAVRYARKGIDWGSNRGNAAKAAFLGLALTVYLAGLAFAGIVSAYSAVVLLGPLLFACIFLALEKGIRKEFFLKRVRLNMLEEDEVVAAEFLDEGLKKRLGLGLKGVFGKSEIERLRGLGVREVPVYRGMPPFGPFIFLGCLIALAQPELLGILFA